MKKKKKKKKKKKNLQRITNICHFKPVWVERQSFLHMRKARKSFKQTANQSPPIFCSLHTGRQACILKDSSGRPKLVIFLMIKKWHYLAVKSLSRLFREITLNHDGGHYCMNSLYSFWKESKLKSHENICKKHDYCRMVMP